MTTVKPVNIAQAIYLTLVETAMKTTTITYEELAVRHNLPAKGSQLGACLSPILSDIFMWCNSHGHPNLTVLVVRKSGPEAGLPGKGFWGMFDRIDQPLVTKVTSRDSKRTLTEMWSREAYNYFGTL